MTTFANSELGGQAAFSKGSITDSAIALLNSGSLNLSVAGSRTSNLAALKSVEVRIASPLQNPQEFGYTSEVYRTGDVGVIDVNEANIVAATSWNLSDALFGTTMLRGPTMIR